MKVIALAILVSSVIADTSLGCFSSISGGKNVGTYSYQTPSYCAQQCPDSPYVALTGGNLCYCLSVKPSDETDSSDCNTPCFGYGLETCGGSSAYNVYMANNGAGVASDNGASASTDSSGTGSSSTSSAASGTSSHDSSSITASASSQTVVTTSAGSSIEVLTVTASSSHEPSSSASASKHHASKKSSNVGPIVGGVVGGVVGVALISVAAFFILRHKHNDDDDDDEEFFDKPIAGNSIKRNNLGTNKSKRSLRSNALDMPMTNPFTHPADELPNNNPNPNPHVGFADPRLNPIMLGRRRLSEASLADETDYSRKILQVANPDD